MNEAGQSDIRAMVEARIGEERKVLGEPEEGGGETLDSEFVFQCLENNELGDGVLFAALHRGKFLHNATSGEWLEWVGHYWRSDVTGRAQAAVESVAMVYKREADALGRQISATEDEATAARLKAKQKNLHKRIYKLRSVSGREKCLTMAASCPEGSLVITGDMLDNRPWLLPCQSGVIDLRTGLCKDGQPDQYLTRAAACEWEGFDAPAPTWEKFILEIMEEDQALADYIQRALGYGITGLTREHVFLILFGAGRNGKGSLIETLQRVLGPLAGPIPSDMLLDQGRARSSAGPSPDIMSLRGLRLAFASETDQGRRFSASRVKWLSGGDTLTGRNPHDRLASTFQPSHFLILATNFKPKANADDLAFWARMHLVNFNLSFKEKPIAPNERKIDKELEEKLLKEAPGILAWLVRGCVQWQQEGLNPPPAILAATAEYRRSEDLLADFLEEKCIVDKDSEASAKSLYSSFKTWFEENVGDKVPTQRKFGDLMARRFSKDHSGPGKTVMYQGVELRSHL